MDGRIGGGSMICSYDLEFIHFRRGSLYNLMSNYDGKVAINFSGPPVKDRGENYFHSKASVSCEETGDFLFTDIIKSLLQEDSLLEIGGTFIQSAGKGYIDSFGSKQYVEV
jgi:hypothetical protein